MSRLRTRPRVNHLCDVYTAYICAGILDTVSQNFCKHSGASESDASSADGEEEGKREEQEKLEEGDVFHILEVLLYEMAHASCCFESVHVPCVFVVAATGRNPSPQKQNRHKVPNKMRKTRHRKNEQLAKASDILTEHPKPYTLNSKP